MSVRIFSVFDVPGDSGIAFTAPSMAAQEFADEADINTIMDRYKTTGLLVDPLIPRSVQPEFGDYSSVDDFHTAQNIIAEAQELFFELPASLRKRFSNDPAEMLRFLEDPSNRDEAISLGFIDSPPVVDNPPIVSPPDGGKGSDPKPDQLPS